MPDPGDERSRPRLLLMLAAVAATVAAVGLVTGIQPRSYEAKRPPPRAAAEPGDIPAARSHAELERHPWGSSPVSSGWTRALEVAARAEPAAAAPGASVADAVADRSKARAFEGAPPVVPHPVRPGGAPECLACHAEEFALGGRRANGVPHPTFSSCTQCHVSSAPSLAGLEAAGPGLVESEWVGLAAAGGGEIAYAGAPPAVPHATWMRERCESCHGPAGRAPLRTPHPERRSCLQCHPALSENGPPGAR